MNYPLYIVFAILPSIIWLSFYLRQDKRPEPKRMVIKIFILGMIIAIPAIILERAAADLYGFLNKFCNPQVCFILYVFLGIAFVEEFLKYLTVRFSVLKDPELDEPIDVIIYLIIAALGFAAMENLLLFFRPSPALLSLSLQEMAFTSFVRMITATFLHALSSGILGYFIALSFYKVNRRKTLAIFGITLATLLHGFYNFSIMDMEGLLKYVIMIILLASMASLLSAFILKIKKLQSVCK